MSHRLVAAFALVAMTTGPALAAPKKRAARAEFDRGVAAYTKGDYTAAAEALGKSYELESDAETLFAWAQTERKLDRCDKALDLYAKLLAMKLPEENKDAVRVQIVECEAILSTQTPPEPEPEPEPTVPDIAPAPEPAPPPITVSESPAWWKNPVGGVLVGLGVVGLGVGTVFIVQGSSADSDKANATTYDAYQELADKAESRGRLGVIGLVAGAALVTGGVIWYATHRGKPADRAVSGWLSPSGGGLAVAGRW